MTPLWVLWILFAGLVLSLMGAGMSEKVTRYNEIADRRVVLQWSLLVLVVAVFAGIVATGIALAVTS